MARADPVSILDHFFGRKWPFVRLVDEAQLLFSLIDRSGENVFSILQVFLEKEKMIVLLVHLSLQSIKLPLNLLLFPCLFHQTLELSILHYQQIC